VTEKKLNCFEARQEFAPFWKRELSAETRAALVEHLAGCSKCDRAFRNFALSAPVLHSTSEPPRRQAAERTGMRNTQSRRPPAVGRGEAHRRGLAMSAAAMFLVAASLGAYLSVTAPIGSLNDELSSDPSTTQLFGSDLNSSGEDLAG
jgi:anti-sigma factor RsiW